jgi:anti-anti-sigma factor
MDLRVSTRKFANVTILDLRGRMVIGAGNDSFAAELRKLTDSATCDVLINLAEVTHMDSSAIGILVRSFVALKRGGRILKILNPTPPVTAILKVTGLAGTLPCFTDEAEALASFAGGAQA